jgi:diguanylate cyclase (GGDEF)-like protein/PAS domain S-box-containing protein
MVNETLIFIVEDDPIIGKHLHRLLVEFGYQVAGPVSRGEDAVIQVSQCHPNLILMDITLEGEMDGIQAAEIIRSQYDIPIVYLTAYTDKKTLLRAKVTDPFGYLIKPFDERGLQTCIEMALSKHKLENEIRKSEIKFRTLVENIGEGISIVDQNEVITFANPAAEEIFNVGKNGLAGKSLKEFTTSDAFKKILEQTERRKAGEKSVYEFEIDRPDGQTRNLLVTATPLTDPMTGFQGGFGVLRDITELKEAQENEKEQRLLSEALREVSIALSSTLNLNQVFDLILTNVDKVVPHDTANIMLIERKKAKIVRISGYEKFGYTKDFGNLEFDIISSPDYQRKLKQKRTRIIADTLEDPLWKDLTGTNFIRSNLSAPIIVKNKVVGFINLDARQPGFFTQVHAERLTSFAYQAAIAIENARMYEQMQYLAVTDELTGIFNRRGIIETGEKEFNRAVRFGHPLSLLWIDFDHYKNINDVYGHETGDKVIKNMVTVCRKKLRDIDSFGRMGGDEFIILLPETELKGGVNVAERLRKIVEKTKTAARKNKISVTASFGVTELSLKNNGFSKMLSAADDAMYAAKKAGRNCVRSA